MDITKKTLIISIIAIVLCLAVATVCLIVTKFSTWAIVLSAVIVGLSIFSSVLAFVLVKRAKA